MFIINISSFQMLKATNYYFKDSIEKRVKYLNTPFG